MDRDNFKRTFIVLKQQESAYAVSDAGVSGFVRVDVSGKKGDMLCRVQGIKTGSNAEYVLYLISHEEVYLEPIRIGTIDINNSAGELLYKFNADNVADSGHSVNDFTAFVVIAQELGRQTIWREPSCLLLGFRGEPFDWKKSFRRSFISMNESAVETREDSYTVENFDSPLCECAHCCGSDGEIKVEDKEAEHPVIQLQTPEQEQEQGQEQQSEQQLQQEQEKEDLQHQDIGRAEELNDEITTSGVYYKDTQTAVENECLSYTNMQYKCDSCVFHQTHQEDQNAPTFIYGKRGSIQNLIHIFEKYFPIYEPFEWGRRSYRWWKISNPMCLSNMLSNYNVKMPFLYEPAVMTAFYKYRYIIAGTYKSRRGNQYIACGIPSTFGVDKRLLGPLARWMPVKYKRPMIGDFGYWVVYIEPSTGDIVS